MDHMRSLRVRTLILILLMVGCNATGDVFLKRGMRDIGEVALRPSALASAFTHTVTSGTIWVGIGFLLSAFLVYLMLLSWADYSYVLPASSFGYAVVATFGVIFLGEKVSLLRWSGVLLICLGVGLVGQTKPRTTQGGA